jgi:hypothetical protein
MGYLKRPEIRVYFLEAKLGSCVFIHTKVPLGEGR